MHSSEIVIGMASKDLALASVKGPVKLNPDKTNFEQVLQYAGYEENPDISYDELKAVLLKHITYGRPNISVPKVLAYLEEANHKDQGMYVYEKYIRDGKKNYRISKEFGEALSKTKLDISCKYIPKLNKCYNIQFHNDVLLKSLFGEEDITYKNCYVSIEDCSTDYDKLKGYHKRIMVILPVYLNGNEFYSTYDFVNLVFKDDDQKVTEALVYSAANLKGRGITKEGEGIIKYITNLILYINSGDPDIRELKKPKIPKETKNPKKFQKKNRHRPLLDIIEVGFSYMKGITYQVSSTDVRGHFRWQPCGEERSQVKLIWVKEHTRSFDKKVIS
jgi:hypothetical protein